MEKRLIDHLLRNLNTGGGAFLPMVYPGCPAILFMSRSVGIVMSDQSGLEGVYDSMMFVDKSAPPCHAPLQSWRCGDGQSPAAGSCDLTVRQNHSEARLERRDSRI